ncbi:MAG: triose-phosphate isomerase [Bacteroidales bacterium]|nr:triose-phosphate isomerase [Bacteroidales bacterium]
MRTKIVAGNWKMNTVVSEGKELVDGILSKLSTVPSDVQLIVAPPFTHLSEVASKLAGSSIALAAQNCADHEKGAYTGEVSVAMLKSVGCSYVILGHSERREYYGETSETLVTKVKLALAAGLKPIFCVGEVKDERVAGKHFEVVGKQIEEVLFTLTAEEMAQVVIAYEPVWAIGTGLTATSEQAQEIHAFIRKVLADKFGAALAEEITILYGGSCKPSNAPELFAQPDIDGGLIGGAALKAEDFIGIATSY